jgi:hypothetical protein
MNITDITNWPNENSGLLALLIFIATSSVGVALWICRIFKNKRRNKPKLLLSVIDQPTMCSSFSIDSTNKDLHGTAFLVYLKIKNDGQTLVQIGDIHLGYKSESKEYSDFQYWLKDETILLEDYASPIGDKIKVYPFLKQKNRLINNDIQTYLRPGELINGLVYFEQEASTGENSPYMEPDYRVETIIVVHDSNGNKWSVEHRVIKVQIEPIRKICPSFGLTRQSV